MGRPWASSTIKLLLLFGCFSAKLFRSLPIEDERGPILKVYQWWRVKQEGEELGVLHWE